MNIYDSGCQFSSIRLCGRSLEICCFVQVIAASGNWLKTWDPDESSAEDELYHHAQSYSDYLDFESRRREKTSFRINERSSS